MLKKVETTLKCSVYTMSKECFKSIDIYLRQFPDIMGETSEETQKNIQELPLFKNGCFSYLQAEAFAEYYHSI